MLENNEFPTGALPLCDAPFFCVQKAGIPPSASPETARFSVVPIRCPSIPSPYQLLPNSYYGRSWAGEGLERGWRGLGFGVGNQVVAQGGGRGGCLGVAGRRRKGRGCVAEKWLCPSMRGRMVGEKNASRRFFYQKCALFQKKCYLCILFFPLKKGEDSL